MMTGHLDFGKHLKAMPHDAAIRKTYLGQAHIAGTGQEGKTCRECAFWGLCKKGEIVSPGHYAANNKKQGGGAEERPVPSLPASQGQSSFYRRGSGLPLVRAERNASCVAGGGF